MKPWYKQGKAESSSEATGQKMLTALSFMPADMGRPMGARKRLPGVVF